MAEFVRSAYHGHPDLAFVGLCDLAERVGLRVELDVSAVKHGWEDCEYRHVIALMVRSDDPLFDPLKVTVRRGLGDTLGTMAAAARRELERRLT